MSWTYSGDPSTGPLDAVRAQIGDTDIDNQILSNEEINFAITLNPDTLSASIQCVEYIIAKFAPEVDRKIGPETLSNSQLTSNYSKLLKTLQKARLNRYAAPSADVSTDRLFEVGMFDCNTV